MPQPTEDAVSRHLGPDVVQRLTTGGKKWNLTCWEKVCRAAYYGLPLARAAPLAGISRQTLQNWREDEEALQMSWEYWDSQGVQDLAESVQKGSVGASGDPLIARSMLERREPALRPAPKQIEVTGKDQGPAKIILERMDGSVPPMPEKVKQAQEASQG